MFTLISKSFFPNNLKHCCRHKIQKCIFAKKQFIIISVWTLNILSFCFIHILHSRPSFTELGLKQFSMQLASYCKKKKKWEKISLPCIQTQSWISLLEWWTTDPTGNVTLMQTYKSETEIIMTEQNQLILC